jgi:hypothetical protein
MLPSLEICLTVLAAAASGSPQQNKQQQNLPVGLYIGYRAAAEPTDRFTYSIARSKRPTGDFYLAQLKVAELTEILHIGCPRSAEPTSRFSNSTIKSGRIYRQVYE